MIHKHEDTSVDVTVEEAIERIHTLLHQAVRARKLSKIRDKIYTASSILVSVEEAVSSSSMYPADENVTLERDELED